MSQLANFTCRACGLTGTLPPSWLSANLQKLLLPSNQLNGALPAPPADPKAPPCKLQVLELSYNKLDQVPEPAFWNHTRAGLQELYLQGNTFPLVPASGRHALKVRQCDQLSSQQLYGRLSSTYAGSVVCACLLPYLY